MENEGELSKNPAKHTDGGFSEEKIDKQVDLGISSKQAQAGQIFTPKKKSQTVFQAQKEEEK